MYHLKDNTQPYKMTQYRNRNLDISTTPTKARSREPAYSQALIQNKIDRQIQRVRQAGRQSEWCLGLIHAHIAGRIKSYEFLTAFVFTSCHEIQESVKVVTCSATI